MLLSLLLLRLSRKISAILEDCPAECTGRTKSTTNLAARFARKIASCTFTSAQEAELADLEAVGPEAAASETAGGAPQPAASETLTQEICDFGRLPRRVRGTEPDQIHERKLAARLAHIRASGEFTSAQEAELAALEAIGSRPLLLRRWRKKSVILADCPVKSLAESRAKSTSGASLSDSLRPEPLASSVPCWRRSSPAVLLRLFLPRFSHKRSVILADCPIEPAAQSRTKSTSGTSLPDLPV